LEEEHLFSGKKQGAPLSYLELWIDAPAKDRIVKELGAIDVRFELLTPSKQGRASDIPDEHYQKMDWSAW
jgi:hypothetical protein